MIDKPKVPGYAAQHQIRDKHHAAIHETGPIATVEAGEGNRHAVEVTGTTWFAIEEGVLVRSELETTTILGSPKADVSTRVVVVLTLLPDPLASEGA